MKVSLKFDSTTLVAKLQWLGWSIDDGDRQIIDGNYSYKNGHRRCLQEFEFMKTKKF